MTTVRAQHEGPVTVATFPTYTEALVAKSAVEAAGVRCWIPNENFIRLEGGIAPGLALQQNGVCLQVMPKDAEAAREVLAPVD